jgi:hypothetical protein
MPSENVVNRLVDIFKWVADICDGGDVKDLPGLKKAYEKHMKNPEFAEFYGKLVDEHHKEVFGG